MAIEKYISTSFHIERSYDCETKVASVQFPTFIPPEIQGYIEKLMAKGPDPRFSYVHVIAMTDGDRYGSNLNGDTFSWDELTGIQSPEEAAKNTGQYQGQQLPRYKTFEQANFFKHHDNNEFSPKFGDVPCAAINEPMRRIELIIRVARQAIRELGMQDGSSTLLNFDRHGYFTVSMGCVADPDFPVLTLEGYKRIADIKVGDMVYTKNKRWRPVTVLRNRPWSGTLRKFWLNGMSVPLELTNDHPMWSVVFAGSREVAAVCWKATRAFKNPAEFERLQAGWAHAEHIGVGDRLFYLPVQYPKDQYAAISDLDLAKLMGYYLAEGSFTGSKEAPLAIQLACNMTDDLPREVPALLSRIFPGVTCQLGPMKNSKVGLTVNVFSAEIARFMLKYIGRGSKNKVIPPEIMVADDAIKLAFAGAWFSGDGFVDAKGIHWSSANLGLVLQGRDLLASCGIPSSIYRITHKAGSGFSAADTVEYTLNIGHFDAGPLIPYAGRKLDSLPAYAASRSRARPMSMRKCPDGSYAFRIKKVETRDVVDHMVYNFEVAEDESYSLGGLLSHNCRIDHEECSVCRNKNQFIHQRCHHLSSMMNQVLPDGRQVTAANRGVRFFDISDVEFNPADTNAIAMAKVASAGPHSALNQARDVGDMNQWWSKQSEIEKHIPMDAASIMAPRTAPAGTVAAVPPIPEEALKIAGVVGLSAFVSTAAAMGIVLSPDELLTATAAAEPSKIASFDGDFDGFTLRLDNIDQGVYHALLSSVPSRSGFVAPCAAAGWEPSKIADAGYPGLADYYAFYRASLGAISKSQFEKTAYQRFLIRDLIDAHGANIPNAIHHLAHAGYDLQNPGRISP